MPPTTANHAPPTGGPIDGKPAAPAAGLRNVRWAVFVVMAGMAMFCRGFLLVRTLTDERNLKPSPLTRHNPPFKRAVVLLFDAVRFDMLLPDPQDKSAWRNQLSTPHRLSVERPQQAKLFRFLADPPTATTQRLAGLTAGNLPTFIEVGDSFSGNALRQDNFVSQMIAHNLSVHFYGDDTWTHMYPELSSNAHGLHSFHLFDLDTVDDAIEARLHKRVESNDFDVVIGHYLGMDHCGHKFGPGHASCAAKLRQYDSIIQRVIDKLPQDTLLVAMSDHGMTDGGDHGGMSPREVSAFLFLYSSRPNTWPANGNVDALAKTRVAPADLDFFPNSPSHNARTVEQVDFCATLTSLMGLPVPFANLGRIIPEAFSFLSAKDLHSLLAYNLQQIRTFLRREFRSLPTSTTGDDSLQSLYVEGERLLQWCRQRWARFNVPLMVAGLAVMLVGVLGMFIAIPTNAATEAPLFLFYAALLTTTSFVIFESTVVRYLVAAVALVKALHTGDLVGYGTVAVVARAGAWLESCREEQFPYCTTSLSHRSIPFHAGTCLFATLMVMGVYRRRRALLVCAWHAWTWLNDGTAWGRVLAERAPLMHRFVNWFFPGALLLYFVVRRAPWSLKDRLLLLSMVQRPFAAVFLLLGGYAQMKVVQEDGLLRALVALHWFFVSGHQATVSGFQWEAAFVGNEWGFLPAQAVLLLMNLLVGPLASWPKSASQSLTSLRLHAAALVGTALAGLLLLRHLMIWKMFGPRLLLQCGLFAYQAFEFLTLRAQ